MEEALAVLRRLDRIERLDRADAPVGVLLAELRALVGEAEVWSRREGGGGEAAARVREALDREGVAVRAR